ncbi:MAG: putative bifunctional diguanylate cyclase/phosphodiesterase [Caldilineaceae bacterium]
MATEIQVSTIRYPKQTKVALKQQLTKVPLWALFLMVGVTLIYGHSLLPVGTFKGIGYVLYTVATAVFLLIGVRQSRLNYFSPWHVLATGIFINVLADSLWYTYRITAIDLPFPSYIDWIYLSGYVVRSVAMHLMNQARTRHQDLSGWIDSLIIGCGAGLLSWIYLMEPYADNPNLTYLEQAVSIAYPLMDVLMLAMVARLWITPGRRPPAYFILSTGLSLWMIADVIYAKAILDGSYYSGHLLDAVWLLSGTLMATAALHPSMRQMIEPSPQIEIKVTWQRLLLLAGMLLLSPATLIIQTIRDIPINLPVIAGGSALLFLLVVVRMSGLMTLLGRAIAREQALKNAAAAFVAKPSRESIYAAAFEAIAHLAGKNPVAIHLIVGVPNECTLVASYEDQQGVLPPTTRSLPPLPVDLLPALKQGNIESYDYSKYPAYWQAVGIEEDQKEILIVPISVQQRLLAALLVASKQRLIAEVKGGIEGLSDQVALALESLDLTENLHRQRSEARFRSLVQHGSEIIIILDAHGAIRYISPAIERMLGYQPEAMIGANLNQQVIHPRDLATSINFHETLLNTPDKTHATEMLMQHRDGSWLHFEMIGSNLLQDANVQGLLITARDISERKIFEQQLQHQAFHDPLTGLPNRALFMNRLQHALIRAGRHTPNDLLALLFVDLDLFKVVNDSLGHEAGDHLLVAVANRLQLAIRPQDTVARFGGDEFMILLEDLPDEAAARAIAEEMLQKLRVTENINGYEIVVTASIGVALNYAGIDSTSDLLRYADAAMYQAKREGKGRYHVFDGRTSTSLLERLELEQELRRAVELEEFRVFYQPIIALNSRKVIGIEALIRWQHPRLGLIAPAHFINTAEETGLIVPMGRWVLEEACRQVSQWQTEREDDIRLELSVNLSAKQLQQPNLATEIAEVLKKTGLAPINLKLEITESVAMSDAEGMLARLHELKALGVKLAIDDFGTGYSSLSYLKRFPVDTLKIDRSFVSGLGQNAEDTAIVQAVVTMAHTVGLTVTAEGVETTEITDHLQGLGCDLAQGYYFAKPLPSADLAALLNQH